MANATLTNQRYSTLLGWTAIDFGGATIDDALVAKVRSAQTRLGFTGDEVDGVCGPATYKAWLLEQREVLRARSRQATYNLSDAGRLALYEAKLVWLSNVIDPPKDSAEYAGSRAAIEAMIRTAEGLDWDWTRPYIKDGDYEWCGAFAAFAWRAARMSRNWRFWFFSSVYRLDLWARYLPFNDGANPKPATGPFREMIELDEDSGPLDVFFSDDDGPRAGDILLVGGKHTGPGKHVTLVESYDATTGMFTTIEGNATGRAPSGRRQHGVIRGTRPVGLPRGNVETTYHARRLIRPSLADLTG